MHDPFRIQRRILLMIAPVLIGVDSAVSATRSSGTSSSTSAARGGGYTGPAADLADVAQLVEHFTRNEGVPGSSPGVGLKALQVGRTCLRFSLPQQRHREVAPCPRNVLGRRRTPAPSATQPVNGRARSP